MLQTPKDLLFLFDVEYATRSVPEEINKLL